MLIRLFYIAPIVLIVPILLVSTSLRAQFSYDDMRGITESDYKNGKVSVMVPDEFLKEIKIVEPIHKVKFGVPYRRRFPLNYHSYQRVVRYMANKKFDQANRFIKEVFPLKNPANCLAWVDFSEMHLDNGRINDFRELLNSVIQHPLCEGDVVDFAHELWQQGFGKYNQDKLEENPYYTDGPYYPYQLKKSLESKPSDFK